MRVRYTAQRKLALLTMAKCLRDEEGISLHKFAEHVQVSSGEVGGALQPWQRSHQGAAENQKKTIHPGPLGQLKLLKEALLKYIFKKRKQGIKISTLAMVVVASNLSTKFGKKNFVTRCSAVKRFVKAHLLVYQMGMHLCQCKPEEVEAEASNYMRLICTL